ncbi:ABC transporter F family member 4 [Anopheles funestus]|uniref:ABC transporter F family member 4 n=1 Tax=Anopheles funestus TaxID=62324 RepID=UPI0020C5CF92|nr:ABC transporter F family member 4 [Anopheles funestus]
MPTQKKKVKKPNESNEAKPAVDIKQEPEELKPLSAYVEDRLELIRQVFSCVKPKEIKYLLPDFLEGKSNDVIKERCLDELLGISTKRLHSIINNTKCPTDTESSSEGSDVEKIEEHISLDEISSDSDVDSKRVSKRSKKADTSKPTDERNGEPKSEKEMTVLELLELQARARAIRSQLALEPVTKIEIESEHEAEDGRHGDVDTDDETKQPAKMRIVSKSSESAKNGNHLKNENSAQQQTKRVRLKRNFRLRKVGDEDDDEQEVSSNPPDNGREKSTEQAVEDVEPEATVPEQTAEEAKPVETVKLDEAEKPSEEREGLPVEEAVESNISEANDVVASANVPDSSDAIEEKNVADSASLHPDDDEKRESSPEVIPVEASPETLCISSDSEEERLAKERASIFVPNIEELDRQAKKLPTPEPEKPAEDTEPEEGEISEEEQVPAPAEPVAEQQQTDPPEQTEKSEETIRPDMDPTETAEGGQEDVEIDHQPVAQGNVLETETKEKDKDAQQTEIHTLSSNSDESDGSSSGSSSDSSTEAEDEEAKGEPTKLDNSAHDDEDIVEIHDSGDETLLLEDKPPEEEAKSWNSRWLESSRVAKVMAASRLGNKVREKLKKKKQIQLAAEQQQQQQQQQQEPVVDSPEVSQPSPKTGDAAVGELPSNIELGSVEHYRELVAQQESKQD